MTDQTSRMQIINSSKPKKISGFYCIITDIIIICFLYFGYIGIIQKSPLIYPNGFKVLFCALFHFYLFLFLFAFIQAAMTNPGSVPPNWGFYMGDEPKRRRYCSICNLWKPDRTHHCSTCGKCILTMDHHCPWINNCVGFYNRKFFIQLLIYTPICVIFIIFQGVQYLLVTSLSQDQVDQFTGWDVFKYIYACMMVFLSLALAFALVPFAKFHLMLVTKNLTTIEQLDNGNRKHSKFDLGFRRNISQVLGNNFFCWLLPFHTISSRPIGDGVRWTLHYNSIDNEE